MRERVRIFTPELQLSTRTGQGYNSASEAEARVGRPRPSSVPSARNNLGDPGPPRRRLVYPGGGDGGGELPQYDNGPAGEPEGRGRRAPGGAWGQLSEEARDELTWPLRVESGRTDEPRTIERPRGRARVLDRRELAPLPGEGRRGDPRPPPSPEELGMGSPEAESTGAGREGETAVGPRPEKARRGSRAPRPSHNHRDANRRKDREVSLSTIFSIF